jgi:hypothetical protein
MRLALALLALSAVALGMVIEKRILRAPVQARLGSYAEVICGTVILKEPGEMLGVNYITADGKTMRADLLTPIEFK